MDSNVDFFLSNLESLKDYSELKKIIRKIDFLYPSILKIEISKFYSHLIISNLMYSIYSKFGYLFNYIDLKIEIEKKNEIEKDEIEKCISLILVTPFLWKKKSFFFFLTKQESWRKFEYRNNTLIFNLENEIDTWKKEITILKNILKSLGLNDFRFVIRKKKKTIVTQRKIFEKKKVEKKKKIFFLPFNWKERKIFELGIHTKFSSLDGISSAFDYIESAKQKNYEALAVTDYFSVQSFPEFNDIKDEKLKIIYGCEIEMLEDEIISYISNNYFNTKEEKKIDELTYCVLDLETTGLFSEYSEVIEIGYVIYYRGEIIKEREFLVRPKKKISQELLNSWYTNIKISDLENAQGIEEIIPILEDDWKNCLLVAHNAQKFDYLFLKKIWFKYLKEEFPYVIIDTLPLSWILIPEKKSYSLEKLTNSFKKSKIEQVHRALSDSKLLLELLKKIIDILKEKEIKYWSEVEKKIEKKHLVTSRGYKVKILVHNQLGLKNLYQIITISHTQNLFESPRIFRSDIVKYRSGLLIGASGNQDGEIFSLFTSFSSQEEKIKKIKFYDYIEVNSPSSLCFLYLNGKINKKELEEVIIGIILLSERLNIPVIISNNVYYCEKKEKKVKEILIANEGIGGKKHYLYNEVIWKEKKDRFKNIPEQHLLSINEIFENWKFINDGNLLEKLFFLYPKKITEKIKEINIKLPPLDYSSIEEIEKKRDEIMDICILKAKRIFGNKLPDFVQQRMDKEWKIIKKYYIFVYWLACNLVQKTKKDGFWVGSRGSVGSSFIAYLCDITDINPLPYYFFCSKCYFVEIDKEKNQRNYSCYDFEKQKKCPICFSWLKTKGHNLPFETFFGWEGEKTPDIDLNFSGEYQKRAHNYLRQLLGNNSVFRIGTISTLSKQTAEMFWNKHLELRKRININFLEENWYKEWINWKKISELQEKIKKIKLKLEYEIKKL